MSADSESGIDPDTTVAELADLGDNERVVDVSVETEVEPIHVNGVSEDITVGPDTTDLNGRDTVDTRTLGKALRALDAGDGAIDEVVIDDERKLVDSGAYHGGAERSGRMVDIYGDGVVRATGVNALLDAITVFHSDLGES